MEEIDWITLRGLPSFQRLVWNEAW